MQLPTSLKLLLGFIGMVNYYREMWPHRLHILAPLTAKTGAPRNLLHFNGHQICKSTWPNKSINGYWRIMYIPWSFPHLHWCIWLPLGTCIIQKGKPVAYYSKKLNSAQTNYATIDKELLCVVATQHEFRSMLLGAELHVHTDQKLLELHYVEGPHNVITDTFLRLLHSYVSSLLVGKKAANFTSNSESNTIEISYHIHC